MINTMYKINIIFCWLKGLWRSSSSLFMTGFLFSGHDYEVIEEHKNCIVTVSKCEQCGKVDISWQKMSHENE